MIHLLGAQIGNHYERAVALEQLRDSEERYASTVELAAIGISHVALDGRFLHANRRLCEMLGSSREELLVRTVKQVSHPDDLRATDEQRVRLHSGEISSFGMEKRYVR